MKKITPNTLYNLYQQKKINQKELINELLSICEHSDSKETRLECLNIINLEGGKTDTNFKILETFALSDTEMELRLKAIRVIIINFPEKGVDLIKYLIENSTSLEFVIILCKVLGENIFSLKSDETIRYADYIKQVMLKIFEFEDVVSFDRIKGDWFYETPEGFWTFLTNLNDPIGLLEIFSANIKNNQIFGWFYEEVLMQFTNEQWISFLSNPKFSGEFYNVLKYLVNEVPSSKFNKLIILCRNLGKTLTNNQKIRVLEILKRGNLFDLTLIILFGWCEYYSNEILSDLVIDIKFNLKFKVVEILTNSRYDLLTNDFFFYSIILFIYRIFKYIDKSLLNQIFENLELKVKKKLLSKLFSAVMDTRTENLSNEIIDYRNLKNILYEVFKYLSIHYDLKDFD